MYRGYINFDPKNDKVIEEGLIRIPIELLPYLDLEDGELKELRPIPEDLQDEVQEFKEIYRRAKDPMDLAEYRRLQDETEKAKGGILR